MSDIRMRQICLVAHDLERVQGQFEAVFGVAAQGWSIALGG